MILVPWPHTSWIVLVGFRISAPCWWGEIPCSCRWFRLRRPTTPTCEWPASAMNEERGVISLPVSTTCHSTSTWSFVHGDDFLWWADPSGVPALPKKRRKIWVLVGAFPLPEILYSLWKEQFSWIWNTRLKCQNRALDCVWFYKVLVTRLIVGTRSTSSNCLSTTARTTEAFWWSPTMNEDVERRAKNSSVSKIMTEAAWWYIFVLYG